ncbi:MAG: tRNA (adenosine(37)-N6)-threonylcarbamoyltransferase complex ATPase subunit type 1 TsaE [Candidatus Omnitrophica bacterium]|nr:tRNA (adenosine(37)-N6)-threonylcarbamoyltransferase complex ATPase subunit type 1 TsaE [Candidatus Omnitrophota bacterium]
MVRFTSRSVSDTMRVGSAVARHAQPGGIVCLFGELGSGKTVFTKGIAKGLGIEARQVISPTFILMRRKEGNRLPLYHFDFYRLSGPGDILPLGYEEYFYADGISVIEWAERLGRLLPEEFLGVHFSIRGSSKRELCLRAKGARYARLLEKIDEDIGA